MKSTLLINEKHMKIVSRKLTLKGIPNDSLTGLLGKMHFQVPLTKLLLLRNDFRQLFISRV